MPEQMTLRKAIRQAINDCDCAPRQKLILRARLIGCNRGEAEDFVEDCLVDRGVVVRGFALAAAPTAPDWPTIIGAIVKIIQDLLADK